MEQLKGVLAQARTASMQSLGEASTSASMPHPRAVSQGQGPQSWGQWMYKMAEKGAKYAGVPIPDEDLPQTVEEREERYALALSAAMEESFEDLDALGCISIQGRDRRGARLVVLLGKKMPLFRTLDRDHFTRWVYKTLDDVVSTPYVVVYLHTEVTDDNSPGSSWVYNFFEALPPKYKDNMQAFYVIHPALTLRAAVAITPFVVFTPFVSGSFHHKVVYVDRLEFLWEYLDKKEIHFPGYVDAHDNELEEHPLMDYGVMRTPECAHSTLLSPTPATLGPPLGGGGLAEPEAREFS